MKTPCLSLGCLWLMVAVTNRSAVIEQDFSTNPFAAGWNLAGDASLFQWNGGGQNLEVTWDSARPNSRRPPHPMYE